MSATAVAQDRQHQKGASADKATHAPVPWGSGGTYRLIPSCHHGSLQPTAAASQQQANTRWQPLQATGPGNDTKVPDKQEQQPVGKFGDLSREAAVERVDCREGFVAYHGEAHSLVAVQSVGQQLGGAGHGDPLLVGELV